MSSVQYSYPKYKLATQLKEAGGLAVQDAVAAASENLAELAPPCLTELQAATSAAMAAFRAFPPRYSRESLDELYSIAARAVGLGAVAGAPGADAAFASLCTLVDYFGAAGRWDLEAVAVHVHTLQLLVSAAGSEIDAASTDRLLSGLRKVSARFARPAAARSAA